MSYYNHKRSISTLIPPWQILGKQISVRLVSLLFQVLPDHDAGLQMPTPATGSFSLLWKESCGRRLTEKVQEMDVSGERTPLLFKSKKICIHQVACAFSFYSHSKNKKQQRNFRIDKHFSFFSIRKKRIEKKQHGKMILQMRV